MTDSRRTAARPDLAAKHLKGEIEADRYATATPMRVTVAATTLRRTPSPQGAIDTELLFGEIFDAYEIKNGWAWGQLQTDGYVGYVDLAALGTFETPASHRITALRSYLYPKADLKSPPKALLSMGSQVAVKGTEGRFSLTPDGYVFTAHLSLLDHTVDDWVDVAERFMGTPYLWGGRTSLGLDCSALVQLALQQKGVSVPRDSDQQLAEIGAPVDLDQLTRGDLIFWKSHVTIMQNATHMVHANATAMAVSVDPLREFAAKIEEAEGPILGCRRVT